MFLPMPPSWLCYGGKTKAEMLHLHIGQNSVLWGFLCIPSYQLKISTLLLPL